MNRRQMLIGCSAGLLSAGAAPRLWADPAAPEALPDAAFAQATFDGLVGSRFRVFRGRRSESLVLKAVEGVASAPELEQFDLVFRGAAGRKALPAGKYDLWHPTLGRVSLYLEPSPGTRGRNVRAAFSLLR